MILQPVRHVPHSPINRLPRRVKYDVMLCPIAGPQTACVNQRMGGSGRRLLATPADIAIFEGRTPFTT